MVFITAHHTEAYRGWAIDVLHAGNDDGSGRTLALFIAHFTHSPCRHVSLINGAAENSDLSNAIFHVRLMVDAAIGQGFCPHCSASRAAAAPWN